MRSLTLIAGLAYILCIPAGANPLAVNFVRAELPPGNTAVTLPFLLDISTDVLFLKFKIPDIATVGAINSITVSVKVFDDDDGGMESGDIEFALPGENLLLTGFFENIRRFTQTSPGTLTASLCSCEIADVLPSIQDGNLRIRVVRNSGDFNVLSGSVDIDATPTPEPASFATAAGALLVLAGLLRRRFRSARS